MKDPKEMTIPELVEYVNSLTNEELEKFEADFVCEIADEDLDIIELLSASRLYSYMQYKNKENFSVEL